MKGKIESISRRRAARNITRMFSGDFTRQEAREANAWNQEDTSYRTEYLAAAHLLSDMDGLMDDPDIAEVMDTPVNVAAVERVRMHWRPLSAVASFILVALVGMMLYWPQDSAVDSNAQRYVTRVGEQKEVVLSDGSVITLNTGTHLIVNMTESERRVILERGEAFFDVERIPERPFVVDAGYRSITVLGTEFNVRKSPELLQVAVSEGVVAIHSGQESASKEAPLLSEVVTIGSQPDRQFRVESGWVAELAPQDNKLNGFMPENLTAFSRWRSGLLEFAGEPLHRVVKELNRYSGKKILIEDVDIIELKIFAVFNVDRLDLAINGLEDTLQIKAVHYFDRIVLIGAE